MYPYEVELAYQGHRLKVEEQKEITRHAAAHIMSMWGEVKYSDVRLPGDKILEEKPQGKMKKLNREELIEAYRKANLKLSDEAIDRMLKNGNKE